jgi:hypothetical protein
MLKRLPSDWYTVKVEGRCGASNSKSGIWVAGYAIKK